MILDQLIEKKDLLAYIKYRSETLDRAAQRAVQTLPPKKRERALRKAQERIYYAVDWRHEWKDEALKQAWRDIEETLGDAAPSSPEGVR